MDTKALRQKVLDLAIRGKLVPQDPNDEPASLLLERIRQEKQQMVKEGKLKPKDIKNDSVIFKGDDNLHYEKFVDGTVKCIENEIPFELPNGWSWERLGNLTIIARGGSPRPIEDYLTTSSDGLNWIKIGDTRKGDKYITYANEKIIPEGLTKTRFVHKGDFLLTNSMSFGRPYILEIDGCIHDGWLVIGETETVFCQDYLYYMLSSSIMYKSLSKLAAGSTVKNLKIDSVKSVLVPIPPKTEQTNISNKLAAIIKTIDYISDEEESIDEQVTSVKSKILDLAIRGKLVPQAPDDEPASVLLERIRAEKEELIKRGKIKRDKNESFIFKGDDNSYYQDIPNSWELVSFPCVATLISGRDLKPSEYNSVNNGIPYITGASNFENDEVSINRWTEYPQSISVINDILLTCKGTVGELAVNKIGKVHIARQIMAIRVNKAINIEYMKLYFMAIITDIKKAAGGLIPGISRNDVLQININIPPIEEQKRIVSAIQELFRLLDSI